MRAEPLRRAAAVQRAAAREGFDWPRHDAALWDKLAEEIAELRQVARHRRRAEEELGDLLFMAVNLSRHLGVDAARALSGAIRKFQRRYAQVMRESSALPPLGNPARLDRMEALWQEAKRRETKRARAKVGARKTRRRAGVAGGGPHAHRTGD